MKAHLMYENRDFDQARQMTPHEEVLAQDLELATMFEAMAGDDKLMMGVAKSAMFTSLSWPAEILYRQDILKDCLKNPDVVRKLYSIAGEAIQRKRENWWSITNISLSSILISSARSLQMFAVMLRKLRNVADQHAKQFESKGFTRFFSMLQEELDDAYLAKLEAHLYELEFRDGILISAELGNYNQGVHYVLRRRQKRRHHWLQWRFAPKFCIHPRDVSGSQDLSKRRDRAINLATNAVAQSAEHVLSFFTMLQNELAFYVGCLNLSDRLAEKGVPISFPRPADCRERSHSFRGLYDVSLALILDTDVVGNSVNADGKNLVIITGANQGGKTTFLRSIGQAQLMMQCGMFVTAESFSANVCDGVYTHFKKEEDATMKSGKLDEELERMSSIVDRIRPNSLILFNESFSATNEREGSEIGRQIVTALLEGGIKVFFVTHFYDFAHSFVDRRMNSTVFLRAERKPDGKRTFELAEAEPLPTSYGEDIYKRIFGPAVDSL